jgi:AraC-like DNA-binding protein
MQLSAQRSTPGEWQHPALHPVYLRLLCALLTQRGIDPEPLLGQAQLARSAIDGDGLLAFAPVHALIQAALERSACPWLGLQFGAAAHLHTHGNVGNAVIASGTLESALQTFVRHAGLRTRAVRFLLEQDETVTRLRLIPAFDLGRGFGFMRDALLVIVERMLEALCGQRLRGARYQLPDPRPAWAARYAEFLNGQLEFDVAGWPTLTFDRQWLKQPCLTANAQAQGLALLECERERDRMEHAATLTQRVQSLLQACGEQFPSALQTARQLRVSQRSLFRRLAGESTSFRDLVDRQRSERACWMLTHTDLPIERIAERLGYADPSNFSRSFRRWNGVTPRSFRRHPPLPSA